ncbi:riboflavin synthase [Flavobacterium silvaticum]|uniref:Riboflavin synthase n=1 Tax=Flavobacterium silvaticum TaxID=1852020 RepID=A0A972FM45_9FLAO|nr:riboflavin synthase [Flavobacterium silvaticum]NMH27745.1 riboflavin synthase [Flavobacterium silvaticum]
MFTGIIETQGRVASVEREGENLNITVSADFAHELKIDQSVSHNGICLTVVAITDDAFTVTAIHETITKTNIGSWKEGDYINLERGLKLGDRLDGHIVQGHVDQIGWCVSLEEQNGSWFFTFGYEADSGNITIEKGSITVNGVSLTVVDSHADQFSVAIIPYTYEHTNFQHLISGSFVNLEFDVVGKYVARLHALRQ